jgi:hypothetical protein
MGMMSTSMQARAPVPATGKHPQAPARNKLNRVLKDKHQAVSQGVRRFGKRSIFSDM